MSGYAPDDDYRRSRHSRDYSPEYQSGGGGGTARDFDRDQQQQQVPQVLQVPQPPMPPMPPMPPPPPQQQQQPARGLNESYYRDSASVLGVPSPSPRDSRPRSVPPQSSAVVRRQRSPSRSSSRSSSRSYRGRGFDVDRSSRSRSRAGSRGTTTTTDTLGRARSVVQDTFSNTPAGIGAGLLGAVVGGLVANKASEAAFKHRHKTGAGGHARRHSDEAAPRMVSTILGAVAGGLGANAIANKVEDSRDRGRHRQLAWEGRHGREGDLPHYDSGRPGDLDHRNGRGRRYDDDDDDDDYVYDDDRRSSRIRRSRRRGDDDDRYRY